MKTGVKVALIGGLGVAIIGIMSYLAKQASLLKDACYTVVGAIINEISFDNVSFKLLIGISNKSDIDFTITKQNYNIYLNKMLVATIEKPDDMRVVANGKSTIGINVSFNPQDLLRQGIENIAFLIQNRKNMVVEIKGNLSIKSGIVTINDYMIDEKLSMAELLATSPKDEKCKA